MSCPFVEIAPPFASVWGRLVISAAQLWPQTFVPLVHGCPQDMVRVGQACVDVLPYPNDAAREPLLGVSATVEAYLQLDRAWDCESLCAAEGKRLCTWAEWQAACDGTPAEKCGGLKRYRAPDWYRVMKRKPKEMAHLDQHAKASDHPDCVSKAGVRMMTTLEEWVTFRKGYAFSRGFWAREGGCAALTTTHAPDWHGYSNACRCCRDYVP